MVVLSVVEVVAVMPVERGWPKSGGGGHGLADIVLVSFFVFSFYSSVAGRSIWSLRGLICMTVVTVQRTSWKAGVEEGGP